MGRPSAKVAGGPDSIDKEAAGARRVDAPTAAVVRVAVIAPTRLAPRLDGLATSTTTRSAEDHRPEAAVLVVGGPVVAAEGRPIAAVVAAGPRPAAPTGPMTRSTDPMAGAPVLGHE